MTYCFPVTYTSQHIKIWGENGLHYIDYRKRMDMFWLVTPNFQTKRPVEPTRNELKLVGSFHAT